MRNANEEKARESSVLCDTNLFSHVFRDTLFLNLSWEDATSLQARQRLAKINWKVLLESSTIAESENGTKLTWKHLGHKYLPIAC